MRSVRQTSWLANTIHPFIWKDEYDASGATRTGDMVPMTSEMVEKAQFSVQNREKNGRFQKAKFEKYGKEL